MDIKNKKKNLAEDSFKIDISNFGKRLLYATQKLDDIDYLFNKEANALKGKEGSFKIKDGSNSLYVSYRMNLNKTPKVLEIYFKKKADSSENNNQNIEIEEDIATFGIRPFFKCKCGKKSAVFYIPEGESLFKCRECANIIYESQTINKSTIHGLFFWRAHQILKLAHRREHIKRMYYKGRLTKKGRKFTELLNKWNDLVRKEIKTKRED